MTTIGTLKKELNSFIDTLKDTSEKLSAEIRKNTQEASDIRKEYTATAATFAANTLTALDGAAFEQISKLAQSVPQVTGQSLSYFRQEMIDQRKTALTRINEGLKETVDITNFQTAVDAAQAASEAAGEKAQETAEASHAADEALEKWEKSDEKKLIGLDQSLRADGKPGINPDTKNYYDTESLLQATWRYVSRDESYRQVRRVLVSYKQGFNGRDAFADLGTFQAKGDELRAAAEKAQDAKDEAAGAYAQLKKNADALTNAGRHILTDDEILKKLQNKLTDYLSTPEFLKAAAEEYGEDFPSSLPMLAAKLQTLDNLRDDAEEKLQKLSDDIQTAQSSYSKMRNADTSRSIDVDIEQVRRDNENYTRGYDDYISASNRSRQTTGGWTRNDSMDIYWKVLLWNTIANNNRHDHGASLPSLPSAPSFPSSSGNISMNDIFSHAKAASSISMNDIFRDISTGASRIDLSPPPPPPPPPRPSYSPSISSGSFGGGFGGGRGGGSFGGGGFSGGRGGGKF